MILNLLNTMLITLGTGASVLNMPKKQINPPNNRATNEFRLDINESSTAAYDMNYTDDTNWHQYTITKKLNGNNTGMLVKGNKIIQNMYNKSSESTVAHVKLEIENAYQSYALWTPRLLTIYEITTYENTENIEQNFTLYTIVGINSTTQPNDIINKIKVKTLTYQTQEDWSQYIDRNDYASWNYIDELRKEIESPENGYRYSKKEQLTEPQTDIGTQTRTNISTDIQLTKGTTTYVIQISSVIVETKNNYTGTGTITIENQTFGGNAFIYYEYTNSQYITGTMIIAEGTTEIVDIPGLMFQVLTMPFTFISAAFNLTLFPGTPYQINISNLFMAIIAVMAFIFILKLLIGMKGGN